MQRHDDPAPPSPPSPLLGRAVRPGECLGHRRQPLQHPPRCSPRTAGSSPLARPPCGGRAVHPVQHAPGAGAAPVAALQLLRHVGSLALSHAQTPLGARQLRLASSGQRGAVSETPSRLETAAAPGLAAPLHAAAAALHSVASSASLNSRRQLPLSVECLSSILSICTPLLLSSYAVLALTRIDFDHTSNTSLIPSYEHFSKALLDLQTLVYSAIS